ncbi:MAG: imidazole glycerol phosphate synthase subunit HisF [Methanothrix sp.]|jgi:cyclase|nr:imidazole glycerol phosphate synthase subunit HisF [Methanothrix sp.]OPX80132.1 MAG: Imidazole glycerol phosphate synthase subunit HisF [Methanosaeta sp. PtaB.Bin087]HNT72943.1 imidazole glycerol phosphate synthase subunit HisF [Methanothrix sp.]HOI68539.1 imidazole glycerol phosphate synthase subunit HisF [Methanothrix sp.]HPY73009.1 imidazole glycerol phosphate synthase subunit HisF [Methanothrix sp.]
MTRWVEVCGGYGDDWVWAGNYASLGWRWLTCCPEEITVVKTARIDPVDPMIVRYRVVIEDAADATRAATVTDYFPEGMVFLDSSLPVARQGEGEVILVLPTIGPCEEVAIVSSALTSGAGRYKNVEVEALSVDGPGVRASPLLCKALTPLPSGRFLPAAALLPAMTDIKRIIPCLDVKVVDGRPSVVKGVKFVDLKRQGDPVELALRYDADGADELVFLDITASSEGRKTMVEVARRTAREVSVPFAVGGGIGGLEGIVEILDAGADKVGINTAAVKDPDLIRQAAKAVGSDRITVAIDAVRNPAPQEGAELFPLEDESPAWFEVVILGGRKAVGLDAVAWARRVEELGAGEILLTSMDRDGTSDGYDIPLTRAVASAVGLPVIASGGAKGPEHMLQAFREAGADAALAAGIFHRREQTVRGVKEYLRSKGVSVRL